MLANSLHMSIMQTYSRAKTIVKKAETLPSGFGDSSGRNAGQGSFFSSTWLSYLLCRHFPNCSSQCVHEGVSGGDQHGTQWTERSWGPQLGLWPCIISWSPSRRRRLTLTASRKSSCLSDRCSVVLTSPLSHVSPDRSSHLPGSPGASLQCPLGSMSPACQLLVLGFSVP